jgi:LuxR family quorum sensing-dependent transcriptional regulator
LASRLLEERMMPMTDMHKSRVVVPFRAPATRALATTPSTPSTPLLNRFTAHVSRAKTAAAILDALDEFASRLLPVNVLGVGRMPQRTADWRSIELGKDVFLHRSAPVEWWNEYAAKAARGYDPGIMMAKTSLVAYTWTETMQALEPIGIDRWPYDLALKYGIRDALTCCIGQRWLVAYWSRQVLCDLLTHPLRILLIAAAGFAASRLEQVIGEDPKRFKNQPRITPRELAVLRLVSLGMASSDIGKQLGIGEETVRSHLKKVQAKLGARNRAHAAAEAIRQQLIP